ncbi:MAG: HD domain-containing protein [Nitrospiraceae bacterium]|nr:HD domain-containing protein [Nitrospiraceae bacterium]
MSTIRIVPCDPEDVYVPVDQSIFVDGVRIPFDLYAKDRNIIKFLFSKNTVFCEIAREILAMQSLTEFFIRERDLPAYSELRRTAGSPRKKDEHTLFEDYSYFKEKSFILRRDLITSDVAARLRIGILRYPSFGEIPLMEDLTGEAIVRKIKDLEYDIVIPVSKLDAYESYLSGIRGADLFEEHTIMRELLKIRACRFFSDVGHAGHLDALRDETMKMADFMIDNKHLLIRMTTSRIYDFYLYVHAVNVMLLSVVLGANLGIPRHEIAGLAIGAILHDVGKTAIPSRLIDKTGGFSQEEYAIYRGYALNSVQILQGMKNVPEEAVMIAMFHMEKLTGGGFRGKKVPLAARIVELANAYDTMISDKATARKMKAYEALAILRQEKDTYDQTVMKALIEILS